MNPRKRPFIRTKFKYPLAPLFPWQQRVYDCQVKYRVCCCGRGSGKTKEAIDDICLHMSYYLTGNAAVVCPQGKDQTVNIYWERLIETLEQYPFAVDKSTHWHNDSSHIITLKNGNKIFLFSGSEAAAEGLRGQEFAYILLDEVGGLERWIWEDIIEPMTFRGCLKRVLFISTPNGVNNLFHDLYMRGMNGNNGDPLYCDYRAFHATSYDNPTQDIAGLDRLKKQKGEDSLSWRREYMAEFVGAQGAVFAKFSPKNITPKAVYKTTSDWTTYAAVDFGYTKGVTILFQVNRFTNNVNIFEEYFNIERGFREQRPDSLCQEEHLIQSVTKYKVKEIFVDCAGNQHSQETGKSMVGMLKQSGLNNIVPVPKQESDWRDYIEQIRFLVMDGDSNPHLFINPEVKYGIESFYNLRYPDKEGKNPHKYLKDGVYDHWMDAFRYAIKRLFPVQEKNLGSSFVSLR